MPASPHPALGLILSDGASRLPFGQSDRLRSTLLVLIDYAARQFYFLGA